MLIAAIAILVTAVCSIGLFYSILVQQIYDDLKANAHVISRLDFEDASQKVCDQLSEDGLRITLIATDGTVLYDSMEDETKMENHRGRPEVERALAVGEGRGMRKSTTSAEHTFYYAMRLSDGNVLRIGKESGSIYHLAWNMTMLTLGVGLCVFLVCAFFAKRMTKRFVEPIEKMADNIVLVDEREVYEEMRPFVSMIKQQHVDILNHAQMRQEFTANVSHELKTPLTAISGYAELIEHGMSGENTERFASEIHKNAARLLTLINDIIQLSQLDGGKKDVEYKDLGLLIIDEEQRFGVQHKEKIKKLKENIDVLTLTATPIPRTLHMSLIGIRDMSVLEEAPVDRMPIQTYVMEENDEMVREAIEREISRQGQVYYVYNRVQDIAEMAAKIQKLVPDANVAYAHGQMREHKLEDIMYDFINGEIDVLVSTTIIETGLDISNANTMIIHDADRMGLSQLYQLRGRVGRSNRMAYAFLLYRRDKMLREVAEKRLSAIREFTDLGSGVKIAMRDLEIRGAGNLLGEEQHGHMDAVGYDLYCKMLSEAVRHLKGEIPEETYATTVDLNIDAYIPASYIPNEYQKLDIYKRIAAIETEEEQEDMLEELIDRFGDPPRKVQQLLMIAQLKAKAHAAYVISVEQKGDEYKFTMYEKARVNVAKIPELLAKYKGELTFKTDAENPYFIYCKLRKNKKEKAEQILENAGKIVEDIQGLVEE